MAVLVQQMIDAETAGVAFTANPVSGDRDETVVTATRGLGESLVSGETTGEQWIVRDGRAVHTAAESPGQPDRLGPVGTILEPEQARTVAGLARAVERVLGGPQDIEWAFAHGEVFLLQARPMTALPEPVSWDPPGPGLWMRNFRLGEWLTEAMTPLFATWLLPRLEAGFLTQIRETVGAAVPFRYAVVHGWYYNAPPQPTPRLLARVLIESRGRIVPVLFNVLLRVGRNPVAADRAVLAELYQQWRDELLPAYQKLVEDGQHRLDSIDAAGMADTARLRELIRLVDELGGMAGRYLCSLSIVGGSAWKIEASLVRFCRTQLADVLDSYDGVQTLLRGLPGAEPEPPPAHAVHSIDWYQPTAGETRAHQHGETNAEARGTQRHQRLAARREEAETACRTVLAGRPRQRARFDRLLQVAQRYAQIREQQARDLTLAWPRLRTCARRLGERLHSAGLVDDPDDVYFLQHAELDRLAGLENLHDTEPLSEVVAARRATWQRQRRLTPPLTLGRPPRLIGDLIDKAVTDAQGRQPLPEHAISGHPASPGRATGPVRIVTATDDFDAFQDGEILVAKATAPAWTPLFGRAAAVVTDGGSLAAHASLIAREYGIPAVVGTGNATTRLRTGQLVTVDGTAGTITPADTDPDTDPATDTESE